MLSGIYLIANLCTGKVYVGQSNNCERRFYEHKKLLRKNKHYNGRLQNSWNKYGEPEFKFLMLESVDDAKMLNEREMYWITFYSASSDEFGYNIAKEPEIVFRGPFSESHRRNISMAKKGKPGQKHSEETKAKMSLAQKGKLKTKSHIAAIRESGTLFKKGAIPHNFGVCHSEESCKKMRTAKASFMFDGELLSLNEIAKRVGLTRSAISHRMKMLGISAEEAAKMPRIKNRKKGFVRS